MIPDDDNTPGFDPNFLPISFLPPSFSQRTFGIKTDYSNPARRTDLFIVKEEEIYVTACEIPSSSSSK